MSKKYPLDTTLCKRHKIKMAKGCDHDGEGCYRTEDEQIVSTEESGRERWLDEVNHHWTVLLSGRG